MESRFSVVATAASNSAGARLPGRRHLPPAGRLNQLNRRRGMSLAEFRRERNAQNDEYLRRLAQGARNGPNAIVAEKLGCRKISLGNCGKPRGE